MVCSHIQKEHFLKKLGIVEAQQILMMCYDSTLNIFVEN